MIDKIIIIKTSKIWYNVKMEIICIKSNTILRAMLNVIE